MISLDTNVLARFYLNDEPAQAQIAARLLMEEDVFVAKTVLLELEWVMRGAARVAPAGIAKSMQHLLGLENVRVEDEAAVRTALKGFAQGMDFADALHAASSTSAVKFVTFDIKLVKRSVRSPSRPTVALAE